MLPPHPQKCLSTLQAQYPLQNANWVASYPLSPLPHFFLFFSDFLLVLAQTQNSLVESCMCQAPATSAASLCPHRPFSHFVLQAHEIPLGSCLFHIHSYPGHLHRSFILSGSPSLPSSLPPSSLVLIKAPVHSCKSLLQNCAFREVSPDLLDSIRFPHCSLIALGLSLSLCVTFDTAALF